MTTIWGDYRALLDEWDQAAKVADRARAEGRALTSAELRKRDELMSRSMAMVTRARALGQAPPGAWSPVPTYERQAL